MIDGVILHPLGRIADDRGTVFHMLKASDAVFSQFGEIYFTSLYPQVIKAWHIHTKMDCNYACIVGAVKVVLYDGRPASPTRGVLEEFFLGEPNYVLLHIPHGVTNGMQGISSQTAIVANCATLPHNPTEMQRLDLATAGIPYIWNTR